MLIRVCLIAILAGLGPLSAQRADQCTAAVLSPAATEGRPMLWKNRDTGVLSNRVVYVREQPYDYLALVDQADPSGRVCWAGVNTAGFGIMNTASYNLPEKKGEATEQEGYLMAQALRSCRTVGDFEAFLKANLGPSLGVATNFGVLDAAGNAHLYEVHNHGYERFDAAAAPASYLFVTNYSRTGRKDEGGGRLRMERAEELARQRKPGPFTPRELFQDFARDTGHTLLGTPAWPEFSHFEGKDRWLHTKHTINRWDTACTFVLVGKDPKDPTSRAVMWLSPGEPLVAIALPLFVDAACSPAPFWEGEEAPLWTETLRLKGWVRPTFGLPEKQEYLNASRLDNRAKSGFLPALLGAETANFARTEAFLMQARTPAELAIFQADLAAQAMAVLKAAPGTAAQARVVR